MDLPTTTDASVYSVHEPGSLVLSQTVTVVAPASSATVDGISVTPIGTVGVPLAVSDHVLSPTEFVADTRTVYSVPMVKLDIVWLVLETVA